MQPSVLLNNGIHVEIFSFTVNQPTCPVGRQITQIFIFQFPRRFYSYTGAAAKISSLA